MTSTIGVNYGDSIIANPALKTENKGETGAQGIQGPPGATLYYGETYAIRLFQQSTYRSCLGFVYGIFFNNGTLYIRIISKKYGITKCKLFSNKFKFIKRIYQWRY